MGPDAAEMFEVAFADAPMGVAFIGLDGVFRRANRALCELLGRSEPEIVGSTSTPFTHPDDLSITSQAFDHLGASSTPLAVEKRYLRPDGEVVWASTQGRSILGADGLPRYVVAHFKDITEAKLIEQRELEATRRFESAFAEAPIGMALVALDGGYMRVNGALCELTGYSESELLARSFQQITHPEDLREDLAHIARLIAGEDGRYSMEKRYVAASGNAVWVQLSRSLIRDAEGEPDHFVVQVADIDESKRLQARLRHLADHDALTGLWNRRRFEEELAQQVGRCRRYGERAALFLLDLDGFKSVNDTLGHKTGDDLLGAVAAALRERLRATDAVARLGGDEFAVLAPNISAGEAAHLAEAIAAAVREHPIEVRGHTVRATASVGVALLDGSVESDETALIAADAAMYRAKAAGRVAMTRRPVAATR